MPQTLSDRRRDLLKELAHLAKISVFGTLSEGYRTCGSPGCRCHGPGPKHGPHLQVVYHGATGKTSSYYVPMAAHSAIRDGVAAWQTLQKQLRELADQNKDQILKRARSQNPRARSGRSALVTSKTNRPTETGKRESRSGAAGGPGSPAS